jgi:Putative zinc-finger
MSCGFAHDDGSYVLGALSPAGRLEFEQHLGGCPACARSVRELAGLPGLLSRVDPAVLEEPPGKPVPTTVLPALLHAVHRARRRRSLATGGLAAAAVAVVVTGVWLSGTVAGDRGSGASPGVSSSAPTTSAGQVMAPVGDVPVRARVAFSSVAWGTRLDLTCTYGHVGDEYHLAPAVTYGLFVRTREGRSQQVGTWRALDGRTMRLSAATSAARRDIASVEVRTADGHPVLELTS